MLAFYMFGVCVCRCKCMLLCVYVCMCVHVCAHMYVCVRACAGGGVGEVMERVASPH